MGWWLMDELTAQKLANRLMYKWLVWFNGDFMQAKKYVLIALRVKEVTASADRTKKINDCMKIVEAEY